MLAGVRSRGPASLLLGFIVLWVCAALYLRSACSRDPTSAFFRPDEARVLSYSAYRKGQARKFADQAAVHAPARWHPKDDLTPPDLCVAIGSVSRHGFSYLKDTLGSILEGLDDAERQRIYVVAFLAHTNQSVHEDFGQPWLRNMADSLPQYPAGDPDLLKTIAELEVDSSYPAHARKQKIDYTVLLESCARVNPTYTMTIEDDVIALDGWFHRLLVALGSAKRQAGELGQDNFLYLRIFYDGRLLGWNSEEWLTYLVTCMSVVLVELVVLGALCHRWSPVSGAARKLLTPVTVFLVCGVCTPMSMGLYFMAGRSCMLPRKPGVELMHKYGCCAQGLVFPQQQVVDHLLPMYNASATAEDGGHAAVDTFLEDWADAQRVGEKGVSRALRFAVTPVLIQHVGGKSSHGVGDQIGGRLTDDTPFDYGFEMNDPVQLAREHQQWLDEEFGLPAR
ncbi:N-Acetylglucosaminyltransferase-IV (GnT-IV) conserved region [Microdochium nivale]|nr:N-Acetylglucosaminyltransferase-IV (GnT-IV) conserved region [Microdochium nivale]